MTEILSQAYSRGNGIFECPPCLKVLVREETDPFSIQKPSLSKKTKTGSINISDLATIDSCTFLATEAVGRLYHNER